MQKGRFCNNSQILTPSIGLVSSSASSFRIEDLQVALEQFMAIAEDLGSGMGRVIPQLSSRYYNLWLVVPKSTR